MSARVMRAVRLGLTALAIFSILPSVQVSARPRLRAVQIKDADTLFRTAVTGLGAFPKLNDRNQIVFTVSGPGGMITTRIWENGHLLPLGNEGTFTQITGRGINDSGEIAGDERYSNGITHYHAFATAGGQIADLPVIPETHPGGPCFGAVAYDLNNQGVASGWSANAFSTVVPVTWQGGSVTKAGILNAHPADSQDFRWPVLINDAGTIAGTAHIFYSAVPNAYHGYYGTPGALTEVLPFAGGTALYLWDINNAGQMAGQSDGDFGGTFSSAHAILVNGGQTKDIHGSIYAANAQSAAYAVNDSGVAVGWWTLVRKPLYYEKDTTWLIDSLLISRFFPGGGAVNLYEALDINNHGIILALCQGPGGASYPCLLVPADSGVVVNTVNDLPDLAPGDGRCYTGNTTVLGEDECSLRAAIQETNATTGLDTIRFNIPGGGVPTIAVLSPLPSVSDPVVIDATSQPNSERVEVVASDSTVGGDGLMVQAGYSTLRGLLLNSFAGSGLVLQTGDSNSVEACHFGIGADSTTPAGNGLHGIFIDESNGNRVGNGFDDDANLIGFNGGAGIFVGAGVANTFQRNIIHNNGGLGIDLAPLGVNANDTLDTDSGANQGVNYPTIDSAKAAAGSTTLYGTLVAEPNVPYVVEVSRSDSCDPSGYGEGKEAVWSTLTTTNALGVAHFTTSFPGVLTGSQAFALTATDTARNTSEYSRCTITKRVQLADGHGEAIKETAFAMYRVANDPPVFTEILIDTVTTDSSGWILLSPYLLAGDLQLGDSLKFHRALDWRARSKGATDSLGRALSIHLDNGHFDSVTFALYYDHVDSHANQIITLDHTTLAVNLLISIEWEADSAYMRRLGDGMRPLSNYLYDVFDGQLRLDTVVIVREAASWDKADVRIWADNALRPNANPYTFLAGSPLGYLNMSRRWFGKSKMAPDRSLSERPLRPDAEFHYRTIGHEFGHYGLGFYDEYEFKRGEMRCVQMLNYGFMDYHYPDKEPRASEMSWSRQYPFFVCKNTDQYVRRGASCWDWFQERFEDTYNGVYAEILRPDERILIGGADQFAGPNDAGAPLQVDVGSQVQIKIIRENFRLKSDPAVYFKDTLLSESLKDAEVSVWDRFGQRIIREGRTSSEGGIVLLGVEAGDSVFVGGQIRSTVTLRAARAAGFDSSWTSVAMELPVLTGDSLDIAAGRVAGYLPALASLELGSSDALFGLRYLTPFGADPGLMFWADPDSGAATVLPMTASFSGYETTLPLDSAYAARAFVRAVDGSANGFLFGVDVSVTTVDSVDRGIRLFTTDGRAHLQVDSAEFPGRVGLVACGYLPVRTGLNDLARQTGKVLSVASYPDTTFTDSAVLALEYDEGDLAGGTPPFDLEATLQFFRWDDGTGQWNLLGGTVDTAQDLLVAGIDRAGVYAAFTTGVAVGIEEGDDAPVRPDRFELDQNYPNPFNAATAISYYLPQPGRVTLRVQNVLGQLVRVLVDEMQGPGVHRIVWDGKNSDGRDVGSGVYFYQLSTPAGTLSKRMVLLR